MTERGGKFRAAWLGGSDAEVGCIIQRETGRRFSYYRVGPAGARGPEVFGLAFYDIEDKRVRCFRVVFPRSESYEPLSREGELSRIAKAGVRDDDQFWTLSSKPPRRTAEGRYIQSFGAGYLVPSVKNFLIEAQDGRVVYKLYKSASDTCTMKLRQPLVADVGFAISLAVTASHR